MRVAQVERRRFLSNFIQMSGKSTSTHPYASVDKNDRSCLYRRLFFTASLLLVCNYWYLFWPSYFTWLVAMVTGPTSWMSDWEIAVRCQVAHSRKRSNNKQGIFIATIDFRNRLIKRSNCWSEDSKIRTCCASWPTQDFPYCLWKKRRVRVRESKPPEWINEERECERDPMTECDTGKFLGLKKNRL